MKKLHIYGGAGGLIESLKELETWFDHCADNSILTFDWETTGLEYNATPLGLSLHQYARVPIFVPISYMFSKGLPMTDVARICNKHFKRLRLIAHNIKYDSMINVMNGIKDECCHFHADTLGMVHLVNPAKDKNLEKLIEKDFGVKKKTFEEIIDKKWNKINWVAEGDALLEPLAGYACEDTYWETQVYYKYAELLDEDGWHVMTNIELPLVNILRDAKIRGVLIDIPLMKEMRDKANREIQKYIDAIYTCAGCVFNINSNKQKQEVFFDKLKLPVISRTGKGAPSTDSASAEAWAEMGYPIGKALVAYSEVNKLISGYLKPIPMMVDSHNVLRGDLNSYGTRTGRFASSNPNLQNQPNNHDYPIRDCFIPRPGYAFINYDYSQLELRVMAHLSKDEKFLDIFLHGRDPHGEVARSCGISRKQAKVMNFGVLYGMGLDKYMRTFGVTKQRAQEMLDNYHKTYKGFANWKIKVENFAKRNGYVKNIFGRKRVFTEVVKNGYTEHIDKSLYYGELRQSVNTLVQGAGADIVKRATIAMCKEFTEKNLDAHFLLQVHDEVLIEARLDQMREIEEIVIRCMEHTTELIVPLEADGKILARWGEMKDDNIPSLPDRFDYSLYSSIL